MQPDATQTVTEKRVGLPALFFSFLKTGTFTFGGGYAMLSLLQRELVARKRYLSETDFWETVTLVQSLPGVLVFNTALYTGYKVRGLKGSLAACAGAILPSVVIILLIATVFSPYWQHPALVRIFNGIRPCVVALLFAPAIQMARVTGLKIKNILIALAAILCITVLRVSPIWVLLAVGLGSGLTAYRRAHKPKSDTP
ncbi:MAG: chromate transporter [Bacteroidales bacterium]|nr:chromate transporter [Bacteroidales bacterium]MDE7102830.1 chromate transporter [Bacteroidales bacterium]